MKRIAPDEAIHDLAVPMSIEVSFATSAKLSDMGVLEQVLDLALKDLAKRFDKDGFKVYVRLGLVKPMTQEELLSVLPRKVHKAREQGGVLKQICDTAFVSAKYLTLNDDEVTCKKCLKLRQPR